MIVVNILGTKLKQNITLGKHFKLHHCLLIVNYF